MNSAADALGVSRSTLEKWNCHTKIGSRLIFDLAKLRLLCPGPGRVERLKDPAYLRPRGPGKQKRKKSAAARK
jgi:hypothetical protein